MRETTLLVLLVSVAACGGSPTGSSSQGGATLTLSFQADSGNLNYGFAIRDASVPHYLGDPWPKEGTVSLVIHGEDITATRFFGNVRWDSSLLEFDSWKKGFMKQYC